MQTAIVIGYAGLGALLGVWRIRVWHRLLDRMYPRTRPSVFDASDCLAVCFWMMGWPWLLPFDLVWNRLRWRRFLRCNPDAEEPHG